MKNNMKHPAVTNLTVAFIVRRYEKNGTISTLDSVGNGSNFICPNLFRDKKKTLCMAVDLPTGYFSPTA